MKKEEKAKLKKDAKNIVIKIMAIFLALVMVLATCSTFIYYLVANV